MFSLIPEAWAAAPPTQSSASTSPLTYFGIIIIVAVLLFLVSRAKKKSQREQTNEQLGRGVIPLCRVLGGHGFGLAENELVRLEFADDNLRIHALPAWQAAHTNSETNESVTTIPYENVCALEIGGPGERREGGGFIGGGAGVMGIAGGMMLAAALNRLTTRSKVDTVICMQTDIAELYFHTNAIGPEELRIRLSPFFTKLRQLHNNGANPEKNAEESASASRVVDQLQTLANLLDKGAIGRDEYERLKTNLLK